MTHSIYIFVIVVINVYIVIVDILEIVRQLRIPRITRIPINIVPHVEILDARHSPSQGYWILAKPLLKVILRSILCL